MDNIEFTYLYRDGGNYKKWSRIVFSNPEHLNVDSVRDDLMQAFLTDGLFIAKQIRVPDVFLHIGGEFSFDDHCYHEFFGGLETSDAANDVNRRTMKEFLAEVNREAALGWQAFDPYDSKGSFGAYLTLRHSRK